MLNDRAHGYLVHCNEALVVHEGKEAHDELAIHAVSDTTVSWNRVAKVFDLESPLQSGGEKSSKGRDKGSKGCKYQDVELHGRDGHFGREICPVGWDERQAICMGDEYWIGITLKSSPEVGSKVLQHVSLRAGYVCEPFSYIYRTNEILVAHQNVGESNTKDDSKDPSSNKALYRFLGRQLDELRTSKHNPADIGKYIVGNYE